MKKIIISIFLMFIIIYPPHFSNGEKENVRDSELKYQVVKSEVLEYQLLKKIKIFNKTYDSLKTKK